MANTSKALAASLLSEGLSFVDRWRVRPEQHHGPDHGGERKTAGRTQNAADISSAAFARPRAAPLLRSARGAYFFSANTQMTPPCGTLASMPILLVTSASWMRCASTPQPDWIAMYCVPSTS
ncbi:hypothetical protein ACVWXO_005868 [Bradyrhizobium sp. LM2.7]